MTDETSTDQHHLDRVFGEPTGYWFQQIQRVFFPVAILGATLVLYAMTLVSDTATAIKGGYGLIGLLIGASVYYASLETTHLSVPVRSDRLGKLTVVLAVAAIPLTVFTGSRLPALLVVVPLGYVLFWLQFGSASPISLLAQATGLFLVSPVTKVLTSGLFFENGDVFEHVRYVDVLLSAGRIDVIPRYDDYPGYHLLTGTISMTTDLSTYHAMVAIQLVLAAAMVLALYVLARTIFADRRRALLAAFALTITYAASRYVTIYFPETVAVILIVFVLFAAFRMRTASGRTWWALLAVIGIVGPATVLTHHLTLLIYMAFVGPIVLGGVIFQHRLDTDYLGPEPLPLVGVGGLAIGYWLYERQFALELLYYVDRIFSRSLASSGEGWRSTIGLGQPLSPLTPAIAVRSLASPEGVYFALLVAVVALSIVVLLSSKDTYRRALPLVAAGVLATPLLLRTPVVPDISRVRFPLAVFFAFLLVPGLDRLSRAEFRTTALRVIPVVLVVALATTGVLVASDDLYGFNAGPDLYELGPLPEPQVHYSQAELQDLEATSQFIDRHGERPSTLPMTGRTLGMFGVGYEEATVTPDALHTSAELFVYRRAWTDHRVSFTRDELVATLVLSEAWLDRAVATENKVYTSGKTGIIWRPGGGSLGHPINPRINSLDSV